jgi:hypothetical protein
MSQGTTTPPTTISSACPKCGKQFRVPATLSGKKIICKGCQTHFIVQPIQEAPLGGATPLGPAPAQPAGINPAAHVAPDAVSGLEPIPLDDTPVAASVAAPGPGGARTPVTERPDTQHAGPYSVVKVPASKLGIENILNEHAADGWRLLQLFQVGTDCFAILFREADRTPKGATSQTELAQLATEA